MLSKENRAKINLNGLYYHEPTCKMRRSLFWNDLYHCMNWTFEEDCDYEELLNGLDEW